VSAPTHINPALLNPQNENSIRSSSLDSDETANDENTVWTDSQDYCADEILSHPFTLTPTVQRAACALPFVGSVPTRINRNHSINQISTRSF